MAEMLTNDFSLDAALCELTNVRGDMASLLQPRPEPLGKCNGKQGATDNCKWESPPPRPQKALRAATAMQPAKAEGKGELLQG